MDREKDTSVVNLTVHKNRKKRSRIKTRDVDQFSELYDQIPIGILEEDYSVLKQFLDSCNFKNTDELRAYFTANPNVFLSLILSVRIVNVNPAGLAAYKAASVEEYREDQADYRGWMAMDWVDFYLDEISALFSGAPVFQREFHDTDVNDRPIQIRNVTRIAAGYEENWSKIISVVEDITVRKKLEDQVHQTQKMEAIGQLTGGLAHDINNIFAIISGNAELLEKQLSKQDPRLTEIFHAVSAGSTLIRQLLSFSRKQPLELRTLDANIVMRGLTKLLRRTVGDAVDFELVEAPDLWYTKTDESRLEHAILNLVLNSRDAMPDGGRLKLEMYNRTVEKAFSNCDFVVTPGDYVVISVVDSGCGMSKEKLLQVFEPFYTTKDVGQGSGLGLSSVYGFVKQCEGHVTIYSTEGVGTEVRIYLPKTDVERLENAKSSPRAAPVSSARGETILVVEDELILCELVTSMLEELGYRVLVANYGLEAMEHLQSNDSIDLLLSDLGLPGGMNGVDVAERAQELIPEIKILFMSGYIEDSYAQYPNIDNYGKVLDKPSRKSLLAEKLRELLDEQVESGNA